MNDLIGNIASMTSLEIAELLNCQHNNVRISIKRLEKRGVIHLPSVQLVEDKESLSPNKKTKIYVFSGEQGKRDSIVVVAQLSPAFTGALVDRWLELETGKKQVTDDAAWAQTRAVSTQTRKGFTDVAQSHGVQSIGYAMCTNAMYKPLYGGTAKELKTRRGLKPRDSLKDNMTRKELGALILTEEQSADNIVAKDLYGNQSCAKECGTVATQVGAIMRPKLTSEQRKRIA